MRQYMKIALEEAQKAYKKGEVPIGAVIVRDNEIISQAFNMKETLQDPTAHAETIAIRQAAKKLGRWRLDDCDIYITAEPCPMCMGAIIQSRIKKIVYGTIEPKYGAVESTVRLINHPMIKDKIEIYIGICEEECQKILSNFFREVRKKE